MTERKPKLDVCCKKKKTQDEEDEEEDEEEKSRGMTMRKKLRNSENWWQAWEQKSLPIDDDVIKVQVDGKTGAGNQAGYPRKQRKLTTTS
jgi:hypothetical protein